jgi:hypothetical protein
VPSIRIVISRPVRRSRIGTDRIWVSSSIALGNGGVFLGALCSPEPAVTLLRYRSYKIPPENICYPPFKIHLAGQGLTGYSICLGGFRAFVKTDARPAPPSLVPFVINGRQDIVGDF